MATAAPIRTNTAPPPMPTDPKLLWLTQWLSPAYPLGAFAWSHGLEAAIRDGWVTGEAGLRDWLGDLLRDGSGRMDAQWIVQAHRAPDSETLAEIDASARAFAPAAERLREGLAQGAAFARVTGEVWALDLPQAPLPVVLGRATRLLGMEAEPVAALFLHGFAGNLVLAAQRLMPLGQTAAQRVLSDLAPLCAEIAGEAVADPDDVWSNAFLSDVAAMRHETLQPRLFQS